MRAGRSRPGPNAGRFVVIASAAIVAAAFLLLIAMGAIQP